MIIDSHAHLHDEKFKDDLPDILKRATEAGVTHLVTIGCDIETTKNALLVAQRFPQVYFSAGFHPHEAKDLDEDALTALKALAKDKKCVAIGECGLDYYYLHSSKEEQKSAFIKQIELAHELDLPIIIHLRDAFDDCLEILKSYTFLEDRVVIHCFSGTLREAEIFSHMGFYISLSGIVSFKKPGELLEVAKLPLNRLIIETDCPYLAPHPFRGQRNEPAYITYTLEAIARARNEDASLIAPQIYQNTRTFFGI